MKTDTREKSQGNEVVEAHIDLRYQDKAYNESFKQWRKHKQDSIGFYFAEKPNQRVYQDGVGFIKDYPEAHETKAFHRVLTILGLILLYRVIFDTLSVYVVPYILEQLGFDIHFSFFSGIRYGNETLMITIDLISQIIGRVVPIAILIKHLEMPFSVMVPMKITNKPMFVFSMPAALLTAGCCGILSYFYEQVLSACHIDSSRSFLVPEHTDDIIYSFIVHVIIISLISEFCTHGVILQLTRQFGDGTALVITALITSASTYDITQFPYAAVTSLIIGYFTIRTGSVITALIMRIIIRMSTYTLYYLDYKTDPLYSDTLVIAFLFLIIMIGMIATVHFLCNHSDRFGMTIKPRYMSLGSKVLAASSSIPVIIWFTLTFLLTIRNLNLQI